MGGGLESRCVGRVCGADVADVVAWQSCIIPVVEIFCKSGYSE